MRTLLLDRDTGDLCLDALSNIAVAADPYAVLQNVASACRVFAGECWYDTSLGVPYFEQVFRGETPVSILRERLAIEAKKVPGVGNASATLGTLFGRKLTGQVAVTLADGTVQIVTL